MVVVIATQIVGLQVELGLRVVELGLVVVAVAVEAVLVVAILGCYLVVVEVVVAHSIRLVE